MPLLASKLTPSITSSATTKLTSMSGSSHLKHQQQQLTGDSSVLLATSLGSAPSPHSSSLSSSSSTATSLLGRKTAHRVSPVKSSTDAQQPPQQQQQNLLRQLQQPQGVSFTHGKQLQLEPGLSNDHSWIHKQVQQQQQQAHKDIHSVSVNQDDPVPGLDKQQPQDRLFRQTNMGSSLTERSVVTDASVKEGHAQTVAKRLSSQHGYHRSGAVNSQISSVQAMLGKMSDSLTRNPSLVEAERGGHPHHIAGTAFSSLSAQAASKYRPGESKQTAIDVDLDMGQQAHASVEGIGIHQEPSSCSTQLSRQDIKHSSLHSALGHQLCNTPTTTSTVSSTTVEQTATNSRDSHAFLPVQAVKSSPSFTLHSLTSSSSLAYIPKPIMHASSSSTSSSSSSTAASLTTTKTLPPVPDYAPPPPYPARPSQQYQPELQQQQQPFFTSKPDQPTKQLFHNPFTFPTTGVKVHTDPKSHGLLSYSLPSLQTAAGSVQNDIKQEACGTFRESKLATGILGKSHSDISSISSRKEGETTYALHSDMPCLVPEVSGVKLEISDDCHNHVGEAGKEERRPVVSCHRLVMWPCVLSP